MVGEAGIGVRTFIAADYDADGLGHAEGGRRTCPGTRSRSWLWGVVGFRWACDGVTCQESLCGLELAPHRGV